MDNAGFPDDDDLDMWMDMDEDEAAAEVPPSPPPDAQDTNDGYVPRACAAERFRAGTVAWSENMYQVQTQRRQRDADYRALLRENWAAKKAAYNAQRQERRQQAREQMEELGLMIRNGRARHPRAVEAVPKELAINLNTDQLVFLSDENVFAHIRKSVDVPTPELQAYLRTPTVVIDDRPLQWGMFRFLPWKELVPGTRRSCVSNARLALRDAGYLNEANADAVKKFLVFNAERGKEFAEEEGVEPGEQDVFQDVDAGGGHAPAEAAAVPAKAKKAKKAGSMIYTQEPHRRGGLYAGGGRGRVESRARDL